MQLALGLPRSDTKQRAVQAALWVHGTVPQVMWMAVLTFTQPLQQHQLHSTECVHGLHAMCLSLVCLCISQDALNYCSQLMIAITCC
jgi:hypothetical protein